MALTCIKGIGHFLTIFGRSGPRNFKGSHAELINFLLQNIQHASELREDQNPVFAILDLTQKISKALQFPTISLIVFHKEGGGITDLAKAHETRENFHLASI